MTRKQKYYKRLGTPIPPKPLTEQGEQPPPGMIYVKRIRGKR